MKENFRPERHLPIIPEVAKLKSAYEFVNLNTFSTIQKKQAGKCKIPLSRENKNIANPDVLFTKGIKGK